MWVYHGCIAIVKVLLAWPLLTTIWSVQWGRWKESRWIWLSYFLRHSVGCKLILLSCTDYGHTHTHAGMHSMTSPLRIHMPQVYSFPKESQSAWEWFHDKWNSNKKQQGATQYFTLTLWGSWISRTGAIRCGTWSSRDQERHYRVRAGACALSFHKGWQRRRNIRHSVKKTTRQRELKF